VSGTDGRKALREHLRGRAMLRRVKWPMLPVRKKEERLRGFQAVTGVGKTRLVTFGSQSQFPFKFWFCTSGVLEIVSFFFGQ
jgi:hypothetical protein